MRTMTMTIALTILASACSSNPPPPAAKADENATPVVADSGPPLVKAADASDLAWSPCPPVFTSAGCELTVLHGDPAKPNADALLRIPGGYAIPPHRHSSAERMILLSGELQVDYEGAPPATLAAGNYAYGPAGLAHEGKCLGAKPCTLFIAFEGPVDAEPVADLAP